MRIVRIVCWSSFAALAACSSREKREAPPSSPNAAARATAPEVPPAVATEGAVVGHFETREHRITWLATDAGPRFTVSDLTGTVLAANLTDVEVAARFPELAAFARGAYAKLDGSANDGAILDASGGEDVGGYTGDGR